jgi:hypothetical protein
VQHAVHSRNDVIEHQYDSLELHFPSWRFDGLGDSISVRERSEVYRSVPFVDGPYPSVLVIWSLGRSDDTASGRVTSLHLWYPRPQPVSVRASDTGGVRRTNPLNNR